MDKILKKGNRKIYIIRKEYDDCSIGTKIFPHQNGLYFYKTRTPQERWVKEEFLKNNPELFREQTKLEFYLFIKGLD